MSKYYPLLSILFGLYLCSGASFYFLFVFGASIFILVGKELQILEKISRHRGAKRFVGCQLSSLSPEISFYLSGSGVLLLKKYIL